MSELLALDFMQRALLAALLVGLAAPLVGIFLVQRRLSLIGDGMGHVALAGVAVGVLTGAAPVLTALVAAVVAAVVIELIRARGRTSGDVALAVMFYGGIAGGVVIIAKSLERQPRQPHGLPLRGDPRPRTPPTSWCSPCSPSSSLVDHAGAAARGCSRWPTTRSTPGRSGMPVPGLQHRARGAHRGHGRGGDADRRAAADQRADDRARTPPPSCSPAASARRSAGRSLVGVVSSVGGVIVSFYAETPSGGTIVLLAIAAFVAAALGTGAVARYRAHQHRRADGHQHEHGADCGHAADRPRRPRRLRPRRPPARRPRGPLRRARRRGRPEHRPRRPTAPGGPALMSDARTTATDSGRRPTRQRAAVAAVLADVEDFRSAQEMHALLRDAGERSASPPSTATLQAMADDGEVDMLRTDDGEAVYRALLDGPPPPPRVPRVRRDGRGRGPGGRALGRRGQRASTASPTCSTPSRSSAPARAAPADPRRRLSCSRTPAAENARPWAGPPRRRSGGRARRRSRSPAHRCAAVEVGPEHVLEDHLGVGRLPEQEVRGALLPRACARTGRRRACPARRGSRATCCSSIAARLQPAGARPPRRSAARRRRSRPGRRS